jgi:hypothetical protein
MNRWRRPMPRLENSSSAIGAAHCQDCRPSDSAQSPPMRAPRSPCFLRSYGSARLLRIA